MLAYDSVNVLMHAYVKAQSLYPDTKSVRNVLLNGYGTCTTFQGISGPIQFGLDGNVINKLIVLLNVIDKGTTSAQAIVQGGLQAGCSWG